MQLRGKCNLGGFQAAVPETVHGLCYVGSRPAISTILILGGWESAVQGPQHRLFSAPSLMHQVEDAEATLCEHLGDAVLRTRHLGHTEGVLLLNQRSLCRPRGDLRPYLDPIAYSFF